MISGIVFYGSLSDALRSDIERNLTLGSGGLLDVIWTGFKIGIGICIALLIWHLTFGKNK